MATPELKHQNDSVRAVRSPHPLRTPPSGAWVGPRRKRSDCSPSAGSRATVLGWLLVLSLVTTVASVSWMYTCTISPMRASHTTASSDGLPAHPLSLGRALVTYAVVQVQIDDVFMLAVAKETFKAF